MEHEPVDGRDYFTLTYENRTINLDDVVAPEGKVVTGVRFAHRNGHVLLEIRATDVDFAAGLLTNLEQSAWISNENGGKHEIEILNRTNPFEVFNREKLYILHDLKDSYVQFGPTDFQNDLGQTTIPLIDADSISSKSPTALSGIGLSYGNDQRRTTGGTIVPKLIVYKFPIGNSVFK